MTDSNQNSVLPLSAMQELVNRASDDCTHPASPVYDQPCGPVCIGTRHCQARHHR